MQAIGQSPRFTPFVYSGPTFSAPASDPFAQLWPALGASDPNDVFTRGSSQPDFTQLQAQMLLELFITYLMLGGFEADRRRTSAPAIDMSRTGGANGGLSNVPSSRGQDLGSMSSSSPAGSAPSAPGVPGQGVTAQQLRQIAPNLSDERANELVPHLNRAMDEAGIKTERQQAAFISQLAMESGGFKWFEELASGADYEGRSDLGNTEPGDGVRFKGRGPIQLTGRANYRAAGQALGLDLERNPELVSTPEVGFRVAAWYWNNRNLNEPAERGDFREVTRRINGGYNGYESRVAYYNRALDVLA